MERFRSPTIVVDSASDSGRRWGPAARWVRRIAERLGLSRPAFRAYEWLLARASSADRKRRLLPEDGLPVPPPDLQMLVSGHVDSAAFLRMGKITNEAIRAAIEAAGSRVEDLNVVLDLGCGCGRIARHWRDVQGPRFFGCDYNERLVTWCRENLPFVETFRNDLEPPLALPSNEVSLVYASSVLTHFSEKLQRSWMDEVRRVLEPNGFFWLTLQGEGFYERIPHALRPAFDAGRMVVRDERVEGTNLCSAYHPRRYVEETLAAGFDVVGTWPGKFPAQDAWLLRKRG